MNVVPPQTLRLLQLRIIPRSPHKLRTSDGYFTRDNTLPVWTSGGLKDTFKHAKVVKNPKITVQYLITLIS